MTKEELERRLDQAFAKRIRIVAENSRGKFSSSWIFWGRKNDFYFGAKSISGAIKVSLHENGHGYVGYDKGYLARKREEGIVIPAKTAREWALPVPGERGAVLAASLILPADYCYGDPLSDQARKNTLVLSIEDGSQLEVGVFLSREHPKSLESKLGKVGTPIFAITLDNSVHISLVFRSRQFDRAVLPSEEQTARARAQMLTTQPMPENSEVLNAIFWDAPEDGGALRVTDVGGVRWRKRGTPSKG